MSPQRIAQKLSQAEVLALTLDAEARNGGERGMLAVGAVIFNRLEWGEWGNSWKSVCLARQQFSCWNDGPSQNHIRLVRLANLLTLGRPPQELGLASAVAKAVIAGAFEDQTQGSDHYYAPAGMHPPGSAPFWAKKNGVVMPPRAVIEGHHFYRLRPQERQS